MDVSERETNVENLSLLCNQRRNRQFDFVTLVTQWGKVRVQFNIKILGSILKSLISKNSMNVLSPVRGVSLCLPIR